MEKMKPKSKKNRDIKYNLKVAFGKAKEDDYFVKVIDTLELHEDILMKYTSKLKDSAEELKKCKGCKGLYGCRNKINGYVYMPSVENGKVSFSYLGCKYTKKEEKENAYKENVISFDMSKDLLDAKMKDIDTSDKKRADVIKWVIDYAKNYDKKTKGLYLNGSFGSGKTYLIAALFNELAKMDKKVAIVYWPEFLRSLKGSFKDGFLTNFNRIKKVPFLLIDDIGAENMTEWSRDEILGTILQYRMQEHLPTFLTSNFTLSELENHFSNGKLKNEKVKARRIIERIKQLTEDQELISENRRS